MPRAGDNLEHCTVSRPTGSLNAAATTKLPPWTRIVLEKLKGPHKSRNSLNCTKSEGSSPRSQKPANGPERVRITSNLPTLFQEIHTLILPIYVHSSLSCGLVHSGFPHYDDDDNNNR